jgi:epsin
MDFSNLKDQVSNMSLYDLKAGVRKVQNGKFNPFWSEFISAKGEAKADVPCMSYKVWKLN